MRKIYEPLQLEDHRFGKLVVLTRDGKKRGYATWKCKCDCGHFVLKSTKELKQGKRHSCGNCRKPEDSLPPDTYAGLSFAIQQINEQNRVTITKIHNLGTEIVTLNNRLTGLLSMLAEIFTHPHEATQAEAVVKDFLFQQAATRKQ